jgi:hypothetical protein
LRRHDPGLTIFWLFQKQSDRSAGDKRDDQGRHDGDHRRYCCLSAGEGGKLRAGTPNAGIESLTRAPGDSGHHVQVRVYRVQVRIYFTKAIGVVQIKQADGPADGSYKDVDAIGVIERAVGDEEAAANEEKPAGQIATPSMDAFLKSKGGHHGEKTFGDDPGGDEEGEDKDGKNRIEQQEDAEERGGASLGDDPFSFFDPGVAGKGDGDENKAV